MLIVKYIVVFVVLFCIGGCGVLRFSPGQVQKQNAWLLHETTKAASVEAKKENAGEALQKLTELSVKQSESVVLDYGFPEVIPDSDIDSLLSVETYRIADQALSKSNGEKDFSDIIMNLLVVVLSLFGGAAGSQYVTNVKKKLSQKE